MRLTSVWRNADAHTTAQDIPRPPCMQPHLGESFERQVLELGDRRSLSVVPRGSVAVEEGGEGRELIVEGTDVVQVDGVLVPHVWNDVDAVGCDLSV